MGVVATLAALVLGLLVASAKSTYDARITALVTTLTILLASSIVGKAEAEPRPMFLQQKAIPLLRKLPTTTDTIALFAQPAESAIRV